MGPATGPLAEGPPLSALSASALAAEEESPDTIMHDLAHLGGATAREAELTTSADAITPFQSPVVAPLSGLGALAGVAEAVRVGTPSLSAAARSDASDIVSEVAEDEEGLYADGESGEAGSDAPEESSAAEEDGESEAEVASAEDERS